MEHVFIVNNSKLSSNYVQDIFIKNLTEALGTLTLGFFLDWNPMMYIFLSFGLAEYQMTYSVRTMICHFDKVIYLLKTLYPLICSHLASLVKHNDTI